MTQPEPRFTPPSDPNGDAPVPQYAGVTVPDVPFAAGMDETPSGVPATMWLPLEGAAGEQIAVYDLNKARPYLVIDGVKVRPSMWSNTYKIPMNDGSTAKLRLKALVPGFPTLVFQGRTIYQAHVPARMITVSYLAVSVGVGVFGYTWFGILGVVLGMLAAYGAAAWLRSTGERTVAYVVLIGAGVLGVALATLGLVIRFSAGV